MRLTPRSCLYARPALSKGEKEKKKRLRFTGGHVAGLFLGLGAVTSQHKQPCSQEKSLARDLCKIQDVLNNEP